jgi:hypothetical protein
MKKSVLENNVFYTIAWSKDFSKWLQQQLEGRGMLFKYTIVESSPLDMQDVMYWLIHEYSPLLNSLEEFSDSKRYRDIYVKELLIGDDRVTERFPKYGL